MTDETKGQSNEGTQKTETTGAETQGKVSGEQKTTAKAETTAAQGTKGTAETEESFFDPESIKDKPELMSAYKQMQAAFTKKTEGIKNQKQKIEAYDNFSRDPIPQLQAIAKQYGFTLSKAEAKQVLEGDNKDPQSWDDVMSMAEQRVMAKMEPFLNEIKETRRNQLEKMLDESCPDWRVYEDSMMETMQKHPTLVNDPVKLYRLSVPDEIWQSRATQKAIQKLQSKAESAQLSKGSTTNKQANEFQKGPMSFEKAVELAKAKLAAEGIKSPH